MRSALVIGIFLAAVGQLPTASRASETLVLASEVTVSGDVVRAADLATNALSDELGSVVLYAAPAIGSKRVIRAADLRSRFVQVGAGDVPRLTGAESAVIRSRGRRLTADRFESLLLPALNALPLPLGAIDQRWEVLHRPQVLASSGASGLRITDPGPLVGRGSVRVKVADRHAFVSVRRSLRVVGLTLAAPAKRGSELSLAQVRADTLWVDSLVDFNALQPADATRSGLAFRRSLMAGGQLRRSDLEPVDLVHRGQNVQWIGGRGDLEIRSTVRARSAGALGDWILVQSPFDHRLRRVCVIGPGIVSSRPPVRDDLSLARTPRGGHP